MFVTIYGASGEVLRQYRIKTAMRSRQPDCAVLPVDFARNLKTSALVYPNGKGIFFVQGNTPHPF